MPSLMTGEQKERAKAIGVRAFLLGKRFKELKEEYIFAGMDGGVAAMRGLNVPDPHNGVILGSLAVTLVKSDEKCIGDMYNRKINVIREGSKEQREEFFELLGLEISERYLAMRKGEIPEESRITAPNGLLEKLGQIFEEMEAIGKEMSSVSVLPDEMAVTIEENMPDTINLARAMVEEVVGSYESLVPSVNDNGEIPNPIQRRAVAKAAFLRLGVDDLRELAEEKGMTDLPTKAVLVKALSEEYKNDLDEVARLTLREAQGEASFGLISRLLPLTTTPDLQVAKAGFESLRGHYFEVKPAAFFVYRDVSLSPDQQFLTITGALRSFQATPVEVMGKVELNPRPRKDDITIKLQQDQKWATVTARRASDLPSIGAVLRRSGAVLTAGSVAAPDSLSDPRFAMWNPRSLWILDLFRRDFQSDALKLQDTLMANFDSPKSSSTQNNEGETETVSPKLDSVKLKGRMLHDHPEVCSRIVERAHLKEVEFRIRKVTDVANNFSTLTRVQLSWERDHLAVMTGESGEGFDRDLHLLLVRLVRNAAERKLSTELVPILENVQARSKESDVKGDAKGVLVEAHLVPPEPKGDELAVSSGGDAAP